MTRLHSRHQRGVALIALLAILAIGASALLIRQLNAESGAFAAIRKNRNAEVLLRAKQALIGQVAMQVAEAGERNPGRLPCPEAVNNIGTSSEGISAPWIGPPATTTCNSIGRLPWRTLGLDKLVDTSGEPLWYVVGPSWRLTTSTTTLLINSNTLGDIAVDGQQVVAVIIAPGAAMNVQASAGCVARDQTRSAPSPTMDARDYLECFDFATSSLFVTTAPSTSFNDQVARVTVADIMPGIEAAIAKRIELEIAPLLKTAYVDALWGTSATTPAFPFPAPFGDPGASGFMGQAGLYQGLLPFNYHSSSCGGNARCSTDAITWNTPSVSASGGPGYLPSAPNCTVSGSTGYCYGYYYGGTLNISIADPATNITTGLRTVNVVNHTGSADAWSWNGSSWVYLGSQAATVSRSLASNGAANFNATVALPSVSGWGYYYIYNNRPGNSDFGDHSILSATDPTTGWFVRNEWYRLLYYAIAQGHAPGGLLSCVSGGAAPTGCLQVSNLGDATKQRAILALAGRSLTSLSQTRPSSALQNYLDSVENQNIDTVFVQSAVGRSFNDRFISVDKNP